MKRLSNVPGIGKRTAERMVLELQETVHPPVGSRAAAGLDFAEQTYLARLLCAEKAMKVGTDGVQLLGGHGYIKDHPVERWYRHLRAVGVLEGALSA